MYLFSGYLKSANEEVNRNFSEAGEIESASRLLDIASEFHKRYSFDNAELPGIFEYEVAEHFGESIAKINKQENNFVDSYYVDRLIIATYCWLNQRDLPTLTNFPYL